MWMSLSAARRNTYSDPTSCCSLFRRLLKK